MRREDANLYVVDEAMLSDLSFYSAGRDVFVPQIYCGVLRSSLRNRANLSARE